MSLTCYHVIPHTDVDSFDIIANIAYAYIVTWYKSILHSDRMSRHVRSGQVWGHQALETP